MLDWNFLFDYHFFTFISSLESLIAIAVDDDVFEGKSQLMFDSCNLSQSQHSPLLAEKSFSASPLS